MIKLGNEQLAIARFLALAFHEAGIDPYEEWPEDADEASQDNGEVVIEGWPSSYTNYRNEVVECGMSFSCGGQFKWQGEYTCSNDLSREDFFSWFSENKDYAVRIDAVREDTVKEIARLNQIAYDSVEKAIKLSEEICVPYYCVMPSSVADLDENSAWDASSC